MVQQKRVIFVCTTCDRNARYAPNERRAGSALAAALRAHIAVTPACASEVREVACLNGCLKSCNVAFRGNKRFTYRFSRVDPADIELLLKFSRDYWNARDGEVDGERIPPTLGAKLTVCTPPRGRW